ncbi:MAG: VWA domain-containing protein [Candidatus Kapabacteria bacterium]|nr:VWA domain-containing protein [Ignavibacteriota bacterium]MCW5884438.1 VWA domain-containing protein [Candidatus Kapabacteria bacterium]
MFEFENIEYLYGLTGVPVLFIVYYLFRRWRRKRLSSIGNMELVKSLIPDFTGFKPLLKFLFLIVAFTGVILALAGPRIGTKLEEVKRMGVEIIIAVDVSNSMLSEDIKPNRMERSKQAIMRLIDKLEDDRLGIIIFAGKSYLQLPLTTDYSAAKLITSTLSPDLVSLQGTAIGSAIELAIETFTDDDTKSKALIIITDGENHEDDAISAANKAIDKGIVIHTIGMGSSSGGPIPVYEGGRMSGYRKDRQGNTIMSKLDPEILQQIAVASGGEFVFADVSDVNLSELINKLSSMEKEEFGTKKFTEFDEKFQIFLLIVVIFLTLEFFISEKKNRIFSSIVNFMGAKK